MMMRMAAAGRGGGDRGDGREAPVRGYDGAGEEGLEVTERGDKVTVAVQEEGVVCPFGVDGGWQGGFVVVVVVVGVGGVETVLPEEGAEVVDGEEAEAAVGGDVGRRRGEEEWG